MQIFGKSFARAAVLAASICATAGTSAHAADTTEIWGSGETGVEFYSGVDGLHAGEGGLFGEMLLAYGITGGLSAYLGTVVEGNEHLAEGSSTMYLGLFGTPVSTDHFDLDVMLHFESGGGEFQVAPAVELNWDLDPDMRSWGTYVRVGVPLYGRELPAAGGATVPAHDATFHVDACVGVYRALADDHQLLLEYDVAFYPDDSADARDVEHGGVAFGYNVLLTDSFELINQVYVDLPQDDEAVGFGIMTGLIATLPSPAS